MSSWKNRTRTEAGGQAGRGQGRAGFQAPSTADPASGMEKAACGHEGPEREGPMHLCVKGKAPLAPSPRVQERGEVSLGVAHTEMQPSASSRYQGSQASPVP